MITGGQTETGWAIAANPVGIELLSVKPGSPSLPMPGYDLRVLDDEGHEKPRGELGTIVAKLPLPPGTLATMWEADDRYRDGYLAEFPGYYNTGDAGLIDEDGYVFVMARTDDVINVRRAPPFHRRFRRGAGGSSRCRRMRCHRRAGCFEGPAAIGLYLPQCRVGGRSYGRCRGLRGFGARQNRTGCGISGRRLSLTGFPRPGPEKSSAPQWPKLPTGMNSNCRRRSMIRRSSMKSKPH